jgi:hypothetical protein
MIELGRFWSWHWAWGIELPTKSVPMRLEVVSGNGRKDVCYHDELAGDDDNAELEYVVRLEGR